MFLFSIFLIILPFQFALNPVGGIDLAIGRVVTLILIGYLAVRALKEKTFTISHTSLSFFLSLFLLWNLFSLFWSENAEGGVRKAILLLNFFPLFWLLPVFFKFSRFNFKILEKLLLYPACIVSITGIAQVAAAFVVGAEPVVSFWARLAPFLYGNAFSESILAHPSWLVEVGGNTLFRAIAFFPDPHIFGFYLAFVTPLALFSKKSLFKFFGLIFVFALFLTFSRAAYIGALGALLVFGGIKLGEALKEKQFGLKFSTFYFLLSTFLILVLTPIGSRFLSSFDLREGSIASRLENWSQALHLIKESPTLGVGLGSYATSIEPTVDYRAPLYAHNLYLDIAAELGIIGLFLFLGVLFFAVKSLLYEALHVEVNPLHLPLLLTFVWFLLQSLFDTPLFSVHILPMFIIFLALVDNNMMRIYK